MRPSTMNGEPKPEPPEPDAAPSKGDFLALGVGCLIVLILFGAAVLIGMSRGE